MNDPFSYSPIGCRGRFSGRLDGRKSRHSAPRLRERESVCYEPRQTNEPLTNRPVPIRARANSIVHNVRHEPPKWRAIVTRLDALPFGNSILKLYLVSVEIHCQLRRVTIKW